MTCAWKELLGILPQRIGAQAAPHEAALQEIRLRINRPPEFVLGSRCQWGTGNVTVDDLNYCINAASRYSPWSAATLAQGYITAPGGHRIGVCGEAVIKEGQLTGIRSIRSLCIRVARDFPGLSNGVHFSGQAMLILGAPGWGKTTLLRDMARRLASDITVAVVDERQELFPPGFQEGRRMDILFGCPKRQGIETMLKTMTPDCIAVDEITSQDDCAAVLEAYGCGVRLIATAHASGLNDFRRRNVYAPLRGNNVFDSYLILHNDKSFHMEANRL